MVGMANGGLKGCSMVYDDMSKTDDRKVSDMESYCLSMTSVWINKVENRNCDNCESCRGI